MQQLMQHMLVWLFPNGTNFRNILNTGKTQPELGNHQTHITQQNFYA